MSPRTIEEGDGCRGFWREPRQIDRHAGTVAGHSPRDGSLTVAAMAQIRKLVRDCGAEDWNRTSDTSIFSAVLYRLSYLGTPQTRNAEC